MSFFNQLQAATTREREALFSVPVIREALAGQVSLEGYRAFLGQAYHHVRHTVPLMMACGARLPSRLEWLRACVLPNAKPVDYNRRSPTSESPSYLHH